MQPFLSFLRIGRSLRGSRSIAASAAVLLATALLAPPALAVPSGWTKPSRAYATHRSVAHDLAVEPGGFVHIATEGGTTPGIWYVTRVGSTWQRTQVTIGDDRGPSIALDGSAVVIAFRRRDAGEQGIWTATNITGDWVLTRRHAGTDGAPSLAVRDGIAHLAFKAGTALRYHRGPTDDEDGTGWTGQVIDPTCCTGNPSLALSPEGHPRVAYPDGTKASPGGLSVATRSASGTWSRKAVDTRRISDPALTIDGTKAYVAYVRRGAGTWFAALSGTTWTLKQLDAASSGPPDVSSFSGSTAFVFGRTGKLKYATMSGGILFTKAFTSTKGDRRPHLTRSGGKPVVTFVRVNGGSGDGILMSRER